MGKWVVTQFTSVLLPVFRCCTPFLFRSSVPCVPNCAILFSVFLSLSLSQHNPSDYFSAHQREMLWYQMKRRGNTTGVRRNTGFLFLSLSFISPFPLILLSVVLFLSLSNYFPLSSSLSLSNSLYRSLSLSLSLSSNVRSDLSDLCFSTTQRTLGLQAPGLATLSASNTKLSCHLLFRKFSTVLMFDTYIWHPCWVSLYIFTNNRNKKRECRRYYVPLPCSVQKCKNIVWLVDCIWFRFVLKKNTSC